MFLRQSTAPSLGVEFDAKGELILNHVEQFLEPNCRQAKHILHITQKFVGRAVHNNQVFYAVVALIPVSVMDEFVISESPPKVILDDAPMFERPATIGVPHHIATGEDVALAVGSSFHGERIAVDAPAFPVSGAQPAGEKSFVASVDRADPACGRDRREVSSPLAPRAVPAFVSLRAVAPQGNALFHDRSSRLHCNNEVLEGRT